MGIFGSRRQSDSDAPDVQDQGMYSRTAQHPSITSQPIGFETILGATSELEGSLVSQANVRLDGTFTGSLEIHGNVLVGETAKINADINAKNISIAGAVRGNVNGKKVQLLRTGRVWGDINATALTTEEGAFIDGKISMISPEGTEADNKSVTETDAVPVLNNADDTDTIEIKSPADHDLDMVATVEAPASIEETTTVIAAVNDENASTDTDTDDESTTEETTEDDK